ncbi:MAG: rRNA maturation RNase YbeY [Candidatus Omnitrophota bacterium]
MITAAVTNLNRKRRVNVREVKRLAVAAAGRRYPGRSLHLQIVFVTDVLIRKLNMRFRKRNRATDVLCFCFFEGMKFRGMGAPNRADIYISTDTVSANAGRFGTAYEDEVRTCVVHGVLHVCGFRDGTTSEKKEMRKQEKLMLAGFRGKRR